MSAPNEILDRIYHGEVLGEAFFSELLRHYQTPEQQFKLSCLLQLETEFKARIRPHALAHGVDISERDESRKGGEEMARALAGADWLALMKGMHESMPRLVSEYDKMGEEISKMDPELGTAISKHERAVAEFAAKEVSGDGKKSVDAALAQLVYKPVRPTQ